MIPDGGERFQLVPVNNPAGSDAENEQFDRQEYSGPEGKPAANGPVLHVESPIR
jgi:hypothetical protein